MSKSVNICKAIFLKKQRRDAQKIEKETNNQGNLKLNMQKRGFQHEAKYKMSRTKTNIKMGVRHLLP
jgi:hypothetical protein